METRRQFAPAPQQEKTHKDKQHGFSYEVYICLKTVCVALLWSVWRFFVSPPRKCVKDEIVLITGAGSGIGRQLAEEFAKLGAVIVLWDINEKSNSETAEVVRGIGAKAYCYSCDVGNCQRVKETATRVKLEVGDVSILVNNAGIVTGKKLIDLPEHLIEKTINVNLLAHFWTVKCFLPTMLRKNHGHIVNIASSTGLVGLRKLTDYSTSKFGVVGFTEVLNLEIVYGGYSGVHTTLVCPSFVKTGLFHGCKMKSFRKSEKKYLTSVTRRFPWLLPDLETHHTVDRIMQAILTNQKMVCIPRLVYFMATVKMLLPVEAYTEICRFFGAITFMDSFIGRNDNHTNQRKDNSLSDNGNQYSSNGVHGDGENSSVNQTNGSRISKM